MVDPVDDEPRKRKVDGVSLLFIAFGIPGIVGFIIALFSLVMLFDIPA